MNTKQTQTSFTLKGANCLWRSVLVSVLTLVAAAIAVLLIMFLGSPQLCKYSYMLQAYVWPAQYDGYVPIPSDYSGDWLEWYPNGTIRAKGSVVSGRQNGIWCNWEEGEALVSRSRFKDGRLDGDIRTWEGSGHAGWQGHYTKGMPTGTWLKLIDDGTIVLERSFVYDSGGRKRIIDRPVSNAQASPTNPTPSPQEPEQ